MPVRNGRYYWTLAVVSAWIGVVFAAPYAEAHGFWVAPFINRFYHSVCHQMPERSFFCWGHQLAVCHRCLGLYLGFWSGIVILPSLKRLSSLLLSHPKALLLFFLPMGVDLLLPNVPASRFLTGFLAAFPVALFVLLAIEQLCDQWARASAERTPAP